ncbi:MAG: hypothetical protein ACT4O1_07510 [Gemmatimonadota bacterium]
MRGVALALATLIMTTSLSAQQPATCTENITVRECIAAVRQDASQPAAPTEAELEKKPTGVAVPGAKNVTIADFIPRLASALYTPGLQSIDSLGTAINIPLSAAGPAAIQLGLTLANPTVYKPLLDSVPESVREATRDRLEENFGELDQPTLTVALNLESRTLGRRFALHADDLVRVLLDIDALVGAQLAAMNQIDLNEFTVRLAAHVSSGIAPDAPDKCRTGDGFDIELSCFTADARANLLVDVAKLSGEDLGATLTEQWTKEISFDRAADLVNNQPQVVFNVQHKAYAWEAGPKETRLAARFEKGAANMNGLRKHCRGVVALTCFRSYMAQDEVHKHLRRNTRWVFSLDAVHQPKYDAHLLPQDSARFALPSAWTWEAAAGFGSYLDRPGRETQETRFDVIARGTRQKQDGVREPERLTASATITQKLSANITTSIAVLWANKPEFLDDDVKRVGASFGFRYKTLDKKQE